MRFLKPDEYQPRLKEVFDLLASRIQRVLPYVEPYKEIEHIGSSAIQGALSKGDLDILVRVSSLDFPSALAQIETLGFTIKPETRRTESLCMLESRTGEFDIEVAIQLIEKGSEFEMFCTFRDRLNAEPALVASYNELKLSCTNFSASDYRARKSQFIRRILES